MRELAGGLPSWAATWNMSSVELQAFLDGAAGGRRGTVHGLDRETVDLLQAVAAITGHRTSGHDVGRRAGGRTWPGARWRWWLPEGTTC